ncbi:MAG: DEAD/DEAH box helicase [Vulcanimicrobiota bacterium]
MIVLHGSIIKGRPHLWGETSPHSDTPHSKGRKSRLQRSPLDLDETVLLQVVSQCGGVEAKTMEKPLSLTAFLPSQQKPHLAPLPSTPLLGATEGDGITALHPWNVTAMPIDSHSAIEMLSLWRGKRMLRPGVMAGHDLSFLCEFTAFICSLVVRQCYIPSVEKMQKEYEARWKPILIGEDRALMLRQAELMPSSVRAMTLTEEEPEQPYQALKEFLEIHLDTLVRTSRQYMHDRKDNRKPASFSSAHDAWLHALKDRDAAIAVNDKEGAQLVESFNAWMGSLPRRTETPWHLSFRLTEPGDSVSPWSLTYLLQSSGDPSLLFDLSSLWDPKSNEALHLKKEGFDWRSYLVAALGEATRISAPIERSCTVPKPHNAEMNTLEAYQFLTSGAELLSAGGFGVFFPGWWTRGGTEGRIKARAHISAPAPLTRKALTLDSLAEVHWDIAIGEDTIDLGELERLATLKLPLVCIRGKWVEVKGEEIRHALALMKKKMHEKRNIRDILAMALGASVDSEPLEIETPVISGWIESFINSLTADATTKALDEPEGFTGNLRPYQKRGLGWLAFLRQWGLGACLADDMGLGKTVQTLALLQQDLQNGFDRPVLLICPTSVISNWMKEASRFTPELSTLVYHGTERKKSATLPDEAGKHHLVISSYSLLQRDFESFNEIEWGGIILDEAQNIKNHSTKSARAAQALSAGYRIALTGTPVENSVSDLWSIMEFLNPGFLGNHHQFREHFLVPIQVLHDKNAEEKLSKLTGPFVLRRLKTDRTIIDDLPEKVETKVYCHLTKEQASLYAAALKELEVTISESEGIERKGQILALIMKLKQICNHPAHFLKDGSSLGNRSGKLSRLSEILDETSSVGDRSLIFTQFREMGEMLKTFLEEQYGEEVLFLHGGVSRDRRDEMVTRFQDDEKGPLHFILSLKAGGTGLNLTRASHVFHFDRWWNPAVENQATDRAFRIGQTRTVEVHKFICAGTFEEKLDEILENKRDLAERVVGHGEGWITELSAKELKNIMALRATAFQQ